MVDIQRSRLILEDHLVFFPTEAEIRNLARAGRSAIYNIRQSPARLPDEPAMLSRGISRTTCIDLSRSLDELEGAMDRKSCRHEIRKAEKMADQFVIRRDERPGAAPDFLRLYNGFVSAKGHTRPLTPSRLGDYGRESDIWILSMDGSPVCGHLVVRDQSVRRLRLIFSATTRLNGGEVAKISGALNRLLHWTEIQHYKSTGWSMYDFGGVGDAVNPIARFKLSFGGEILEENDYMFGFGLGATAYRLWRWLARWRPPVPASLKKA